MIEWFTGLDCDRKSDNNGSAPPLDSSLSLIYPDLETEIKHAHEKVQIRVPLAGREARAKGKLEEHFPPNVTR